MSEFLEIKYKSAEYITPQEQEKLKALKEEKLHNLDLFQIYKGEDEEKEEYYLGKVNEADAAIQKIETGGLFRYAADRDGNVEELLEDARYILNQFTTDVIVDLMALYSLSAKDADTDDKQKVFDYAMQRAISQMVFIYLSEQSIAYATRDAETTPEEREKEDNDFEEQLEALTLFRFEELAKEVDGKEGLKQLFLKRRKFPKDKKPTPQPTRRKKANNYISPVNMPAAFHTPNSFVSNEFPFWTKEFYKENADGQLTFLPNAGRVTLDITNGNKEPVNIYVALNYEGDITEDGKTTISYNKARIAGFDLAVLDAICSFMEHGTDKIYVSAIDNLLKGGKSQGNKISKKRQERILLALRKLAGTRIYLDVKNDLNVKYGDMFASGIYDGAMLEYEGLELTTYAGIETYVFHVKDLPAIYKYSKAKGNIVQFPTYLLDTGDRAEENLIPLKKELLKHITLINKRIYSNHNISISNLYKRADVPEPTGVNRKQKSRDIAKFKNWLDYWKVTNYIKGFSVQGDTITIKPNYAPAKETSKSME